AAAALPAPAAAPVGVEAAPGEATPGPHQPRRGRPRKPSSGAPGLTTPAGSDQALQSPQIAAATPVAGSPDPSPAHLALALRSHGPEGGAGPRSLVPQVAVGADGRIVIAEASLTVQAQERVENRRVVTDEHFRLNSYTYANRLHNERWGAEDTELFYKALSQFGTDFTLISHLFPGRQRPHLKNKFKRESKVNPRRVDAALKASASATATSYQPLSSPEQAALSPGELHTSILEPVDPQKA
ncbi:hypothetical protein APUTEX25_002003, partial [Auxenochlorella protothecoides]